MILVTGATGGLGKATIDQLVQLVPANKIKALVRDKGKAADLSDQGIEVRVGDYADYNSMVAAFKGVDTVVLISAPTFTDREMQHRNVISAASAAGVRHLIYTGIQRSEGSGWIIPMVTESDLYTEKALKESGLTYTIVLNNIYADVLDFLIGGDPSKVTAIEFPAGDGRISFTSRADMGKGLAVLAATGGHENKTYTFSNSESLSFADIATIVSELSGREVPYVNVPRAEYVAKMAAAGLPEPVADFAASWADAVRVGELGTSHSILTDFLGHQPTSLRDYIKGRHFN